MIPEIIHAVALIITIALSFALTKTGLAQYDLQITAVLFIILFVGKKFSTTSPKYNEKYTGRLLESVIFTLVVLSTINSTGGITSPFFFLLYFLLFSLALLLEPIIAITTTLTLVIFFLMSLPTNQDLKSLLPIISLAFLTPFAMFLGEEYKKNEKLKTSNEKIQTDALMFVSLMLKNHLKSVKTAVENFMGDKELHEIKDHTHQMEKLIERFENDGEIKK